MTGMSFNIQKKIHLLSINLHFVYTKSPPHTETINKLFFRAEILIIFQNCMNWVISITNAYVFHTRIILCFRRTIQIQVLKRRGKDIELSFQLCQKKINNRTVMKLEILKFNSGLR